MKIIYENFWVKNYLKEDHRSYRHNFYSCEKKAWKKNSGLYGIPTLDLRDTGAALLPIELTSQLESRTNLKEVKPSPYSKMIKLLTFDNLFPPLRHFRWNS